MELKPDVKPFNFHLFEEDRKPDVTALNTGLSETGSHTDGSLSQWGESKVNLLGFTLHDGIKQENDITGEADMDFEGLPEQSGAVTKGCNSCVVCGGSEPTEDRWRQGSPPDGCICPDVEKPGVGPTQNQVTCINDSPCVPANPNKLGNRAEAIFDTSACETLLMKSKPAPAVELQSHRGLRGRINAETYARPTDRKYWCDLCGKSSLSLERIREHLSRHNRYTRVHCDLCGKTFSEKKNLIYHMWVHLDHRPYACDLCSYRARCQSHLDSHKRIHTGEKPYACLVCGKRFRSYNSLISHNTIHPEDFYRLHCDFCGKSFKLKTSCSNHLRICRARNPGDRSTKVKPHRCTVCGKNYFENRNLQIHIRSQHTGERPYECAECDKRFYDSRTLGEHKKTHLVKREGRLYPCGICGRALHNYSSLYRHRMIHLDRKMFSCDLCGRNFRTKQDVRGHLRKHTGEKPYRCEICFRSFSYQTDLRRHNMLHTGEKPFQCCLCNRRFVTKSNIVKHILVHSSKT